MIAPAYRDQVDLMLQLLPDVAKEEVFALKGGTAINMFVRDMPRLSVDIDLTYLPFDDRNTALRNISEALKRIKERLSKAIPGIKVASQPQSDGQDAKLLCQLRQAQVKIEVNTVMRGHIRPIRLMQITGSAEEEFKKSVAINVISHAELFGGKICAALDRQHPRDLFDVHHLLENEGFSDDIMPGFITGLLSSPRPAHELLRPNFSDQRMVFDTQFSGMTIAPFTYDDHEKARIRLVKEIHEHLTDNDRAFLLSFHTGAPDWSRIPVLQLKDLPALRWKLSHIQKLMQENPAKHAALVKAAEEAFSY